MTPVQIQELMDDIVSIVTQTRVMRASFKNEAEGVPISGLIGALRGSWRSYYPSPESKRTWRLGTWFANQELPDLLAAEPRLQVIHVMEKGNARVRRKTMIQLKGIA